MLLQLVALNFTITDQCTWYILARFLRSITIRYDEIMSSLEIAKVVAVSCHLFIG